MPANRRNLQSEAGFFDARARILSRTHTLAAALIVAALAALAALNDPTPAATSQDTPREPTTQPAPAPFDHAPLDRLLKKYVTPDGWVDYAGLRAAADQLDAYIASLAAADLDSLARDERLALLINAYNACTLRLILDHYPLESIKDIPSSRRWKHKRWVIGGKQLSLDQIENQEIRPVFGEPRIHFALNCASVGCPPLRTEAYTADRLEQQLQEQADRMHRDPRWLRVTGADEPVHLTKLYSWYARDFRVDGAGALEYAARFSPALKAVLNKRPNPKVKWIDYDWSLNDLRRRP